MSGHSFICHPLPLLASKQRQQKLQLRFARMCCVCLTVAQENREADRERSHISLADERRNFAPEQTAEQLQNRHTEDVKEAKGQAEEKLEAKDGTAESMPMSPARHLNWEMRPPVSFSVTQLSAFIDCSSVLDLLLIHYVFAQRRRKLSRSERTPAVDVKDGAARGRGSEQRAEVKGESKAQHESETRPVHEAAEHKRELDADTKESAGIVGKTEVWTYVSHCLT